MSHEYRMEQLRAAIAAARKNFKKDANFFVVGLTYGWLEWYNSIPPEKQLAVNSIPAELYTDDGAGTVDADKEK